jgi:hypothetical protein
MGYGLSCHRTQAAARIREQTVWGVAGWNVSSCVQWQVHQTHGTTGTTQVEHTQQHCQQHTGAGAHPCLASTCTSSACVWGAAMRS